MERTVALKKVVKLLGKNVGWRVNPKAPSPEEREAAGAELPAAAAKKNDLLKRRDDRHAAILAADPEYQRLKIEAREAVDKVDELRSITLCHKITVGTTNGLFMTVKAEGDSWEEVIAKLSALPARAGVR